MNKKVSRKIISNLFLLICIFLVSCSNQTSLENINKDNVTEVNMTEEKEDSLNLRLNEVKTIMEINDYKNLHISYDTSNMVEFGTDPSGNKIKWIVLEKEQDKVLLLSHHVIDCKCFNDDGTPCTWETCSLRKWLNNEFYNDAFSAEEKDKILTTYVNSNEYVNDICNYPVGNNTEDKIYCLSREESIKYFGNAVEYEHKIGKTKYQFELNMKSLSTSTSYARNVNNYGYQLSQLDEDELNKFADVWVDALNRDENYRTAVVKSMRNIAPYWLRTLSVDNDYACAIKANGDLEVFNEVNCVDIGVRPLMWVKYN